MLFDGTNITLLIAFVSGIITFFASCLLPLVPVYLAYLSGVSLSIPAGKKNRWTIFKTSIYFVIGFIAVFVILGATLTTFARSIGPYRIWIERAGGILLILFGLSMTGLLKSAALSREFHLRSSKAFSKNRSLQAVLTGITFGFGWTPCIGPVLGVILLWASRQSTISQGIMMLVVYGLGLGLPFVLVGLGFEKFIPLLKKNAKLSHYIQIISGILVVLAGFLLITGDVQRFSIYLLDLFNLRTLSL